MARKRVPSDTEIEALAARFNALWTPGDVIRPWLRQHADLLFGLVHGGWSWAAIARALTQAGITYQTGKAWTADWLQSDFYRARARLKGYARRKPAERSVHDHSNHQNGERAHGGFDNRPMPGDAQEPVLTERGEVDEPEFKLARFIDWDERRGRDGVVQDPPEAAAAQPSQRYVEIMEQLTGKKPSG